MKSGSGLLSLPPLRSLSPDLAELVLGYAKRLVLKKNEALFRQGEAPKALYFLKHGLVRLSVTGTNGRESALIVLEAGQWSGEASLLTETVHSCNAYAVVDSELSVVLARDFHQLIKQHPELMLEFMQMVCSRYKWALQWIDSAILLPFPVRLAQRLLSAHQVLPENSRTVDHTLRISQEDLGHMLGISRQSINKQLKKWEAEQILELSYGRITLLNLDALKKIIDK